MPLDNLGCTCATMRGSSRYRPEKDGKSMKIPPYLGLFLVIVDRERGIPSKDESLSRADYVPALCTHRPSLQPIG